MSMVWPIALIVFSNIFYQIFAKSVPKQIDPMASLTVTYLVGAVCSAIMFFVMSKGGSLIAEYKKLNFAPLLLGLCIVGLEAGYIYAYKNGWSVSTAPLVQSAFLSVALIFVGALLYKESITATKVIGIAICLVGLYFINK